MSFIITSKTRALRRTLRGIYDMDRSHAITGNAYQLGEFGRGFGFEHVQRQPITLEGSATLVSSDNVSRALKTTSNSQAGVMPAVSFKSRETITAFTLVHPTGNPVAYACYYLTRNGTFGLSQYTSDTSLYSYAANAGYAAGTGAALNRNALNVLAVTFSWNGTKWVADRKTYSDTSGYRTGTRTDGTADWSSNMVWRVGRDSAVANRVNYGEYQLAGIVPGILGEGELREIFRNPRGLFDTAPRRTYFMPGAAAGGGFQAAWAQRSTTTIGAHVQ